MYKWGFNYILQYFFFKKQTNFKVYIWNLLSEYKLKFISLFFFKKHCICFIIKVFTWYHSFWYIKKAGIIMIKGYFFFVSVRILYIKKYCVQKYIWLKCMYLLNFDYLTRWFYLNSWNFIPTDFSQLMSHLTIKLFQCSLTFVNTFGMYLIFCSSTGQFKFWHLFYN